MPVEDTLTQRPVALIAAHPDDETIGAGGLLPHIRIAAIVHVTDGAPRNGADARAAGYESTADYAAARHRELQNALELVGVAPNAVRTLCVADQEASLGLADLAARVADTLRELRPGAVLTHPYEGGHPDHDATAFAVHAACTLLPAAPEIYEFTSYHALPRETGGPPAIEVGRFLPDGDPGEAVTLTAEARVRKQCMVECFVTQLDMLRRFPVDVERFRAAPAYDFTQPPHAGTLFYENFPWGMAGERWRRLAAEAMRALGLQGSL